MDFEKQELQIDGMHCDACVQRVSETLAKVPGVRVQAVKVGRAEVLAQPHCRERISQALTAQGYTLKGMDGTL